MTANNDDLTAFPGGVDNFQIPQTPADTYLSEAEATSAEAGNALNHPQMHQAENEAIQAIEENTALATHDHSDPQGTDYTGIAPNQKHGLQLDIQNTHVTSDTHAAPTVAQSASPDSSASTWHHTVGTSPSSIGQYQAVSGQAWNSVGLNSVPNGYLAPGSTSMPNLPSQVASNQADITALKSQIKGANTAVSNLQGQLSAFNAYYAERASSILNTPDNPNTIIFFEPTENINPVQSDSVGTDYIQNNIFARMSSLRVHSFTSALAGGGSQVRIYKEKPQPDGSWWAPSQIFFFSFGAFCASPVPSERDLSWRPDGYIYTSYLGEPGELNQVYPNVIPLMNNEWLIHYDAQGNVIGTSQVPPFNV